MVMEQYEEENADLDGQIERKEYSDRSFGSHALEASLTNFPFDIKCEILCKLPLWDVLRCRTLCKAWYGFLLSNREMSQPRSIVVVPRLVKGPGTNPKSTFTSSFVINNVEGEWKYREVGWKDSEKWTDFSIVSSCNGLLCLSSIQSIAVYNPVTGECLDIPKSEPDSWGVFSVYGFGFNTTSKKYKVVQLSNGFRGWKPHLCDVRGRIITVGEDSWRNLHVPCRVLHKRTSETVFLDGAFHWMINQDYHSSSEGILALDISSEKFHTIGIPPCVNCYPQGCMKLLNLGGCLAIVAANKLGLGLFRIWLKVGSETDSRWIYQWRRELFATNEMNGERKFEMMGMLSSTRFLFKEKSTNRLVQYFPLTDKSCVLEVPGIAEQFDPSIVEGQVHTYVSLVQPYQSVCPQIFM